jgi:hypothetical protein
MWQMSVKKLPKHLAFDKKCVPLHPLKYGSVAQLDRATAF